MRGGLHLAPLALASFLWAASCAPPAIVTADPDDRPPAPSSSGSDTEDASAPPPAKTVVVQKDMAVIDDALTDLMQKHSVPGLSFALTHNEKLIYVKTYGTNGPKDPTPLGKDSLFRLASISKPITAVGILRLVERGELTLDRTIFGAGGVLAGDFSSSNLAALSDITVSHLLHHTSGNWLNDDDDPMMNDLALSGHDLIQKTLNTRPDQGKRGSFVYSNFGYYLLGRVIEKISGKSYETFIREEILVPSGISDMTITGSTLAERKTNEVTYSTPDGDPYAWNVGRQDSNAGWIASATDIMRFAVKVDGFSAVPDLLGAATEKVMTTPSSSKNYGCGWWLNDIDTWWHDGIEYGTRNEFQRGANGFSWVILTNGGSPKTTDLGKAIDEVIWPIVRDSSTPWQEEDQF